MNVHRLFLISKNYAGLKLMVEIIKNYVQQKFFHRPYLFIDIAITFNHLSGNKKKLQRTKKKSAISICFALKLIINFLWKLYLKSTFTNLFIHHTFDSIMTFILHCLWIYPCLIIEQKKSSWFLFFDKKERNWLFCSLVTITTFHFFFVLSFVTNTYIC